MNDQVNKYRNKADGHTCNAENKQERGRGRGGCDYRAVREGLFEEVTFEWRPESERLASWEDRRRALETQGTAARRPRGRISLASSRNRPESGPGCLEPRGQWGRGRRWRTWVRRVAGPGEAPSWGWEEVVSLGHLPRVQWMFDKCPRACRRTLEADSAGLGARWRRARSFPDRGRAGIHPAGLQGRGFQSQARPRYLPQTQENLKLCRAEGLP